jgi:hypothetical protein
MRNRRRAVTLAALAWAMLVIPAAHAQVAPGKTDPDGLTLDAIKAAMPEYFRPAGNGRVGPADIPDVFGPGAVLTVGNIQMKVTNWGHIGNLFMNLSSDPSAQWPGSSGIEYLSSIRLAVGAVNPTATDINAIRRVSYLLEWRPPSLLPEDRIYKAYDGIINGSRFTNDDGDFDLDHNPKIDEDFLDGHDNDGDGRIDEDYGAIGQQIYSCVMRDDTPQALNATFNEKHVPLGLEVQQLAWAYSIPGFTDFNVIQYHITNVSGHELDSLYVGWLVDMDCGPLDKSNYFSDDFDAPGYPQGDFALPLDIIDSRRQLPHPDVGSEFKDKPLCDSLKFHISGFSVCDDDGDQGRTTGIPSILLIDYTKDYTNANGPTEVGFNSYRSFPAGTAYSQGGNPIIDSQRYEFMASGENVDHTRFDPGHGHIPIQSRWITTQIGDHEKGDAVAWCSTGPWLKLSNGDAVDVTIAFSMRLGSYNLATKYPGDYQRYAAGLMTLNDLRTKYPTLDNAISAQVAFEGVWEQREGFPVTDFPGRETPLKQPRGAPPTFVADCRDEEAGRHRQVSDLGYTWFDFDCDYCTGVYDYSKALGLFHHTWNAEAPPPSPNTNVAVKYNYSDNPTRAVTPAGDNQVTLAWDNLSETTPDPKTAWFDARGYKVWKVANWQRPVGAPGPGEDDWSLLGEYRLFSYRRADGSSIQNNLIDSSGVSVCPKLYIPNYRNPTSGAVGPAIVPICLQEGDIWDRQSGDIIHPDPTLQCVGYPNCETGDGCLVGSRPCLPAHPAKYPVGRYRYVDDDVKNGFVYFYSVTAFDSTGDAANGTAVELQGRRSAVEAEGVAPQTSARTGKGVWVVPNPYRGFTSIQQRPSSWDLIPNASDPTGTHIDFFGLPRGQWTIKIYTVSGDLVQTIHSFDAVNESIRAPVTDDNNVTRPGYNRQQDSPNDGQARWNLISRNGQDVVSGIYMFTVDSSQGTQRGHFVIIR